MYLIYLGTEDDWCTQYLSDSIPDFQAIQAGHPALTLWSWHRITGPLGVASALPKYA